ncbi:PadR family transcriptional regulator [Longispora sp. NPDC051575]|uniref:PadR family transcriptional regulator n=1 Tax=Longispora sp. NPDC051575 TaxID=3154943 RepID=UPI00341CF847
MADTGLNATAAALLGLLHDGPMTGGQLMAEAERRLGAYWTMTRSQVYRELPVLAERGYLRLGKPGPRSSQPYSVTASGKRAFGKWLAEPAGKDQVRNPVVLRTAFSSLMPKGEKKDMYEEAVSYHTNSLAEVREQAKNAKKDGDEAGATALDFAVGYHKAVLAWLKTAK